MLFWAKSKAGRLVEGAAWAFEAIVGFGLISGTAVAAATGRFLLGGILATVALGVFLRFKRRRSKSNGGRSEL